MDKEEVKCKTGLEVLTSRLAAPFLGSREGGTV